MGREEPDSSISDINRVMNEFPDISELSLVGLDGLPLIFQLQYFIGNLFHFLYGVVGGSGGHALVAVILGKINGCQCGGMIFSTTVE